MTKRMLIDAANPEEVRVVVVADNKIDDYEVETAGKEQIKGNIYVAEISRVEPSLQAAFVDYGGNRNGFLAFSEIHPQWFDLPKEEKEGLIEELQAIADRRRQHTEKAEAQVEETAAEVKQDAADSSEIPESLDGLTPAEMEEDAKAMAAATALAGTEEDEKIDEKVRKPKRPLRRGKKAKEEEAAKAESKPAESDSSDSKEVEEKKTPTVPIHRRYNIGDVVKEGQKILIQVNKEERGNKGAALSSYISLPGRYAVLMPNTPYAGGISRKITDFKERKELKKTIANLNLPTHMGLIVRTAGVGQEPANIQKDVENLLEHWTKIEKGFSKGVKKDCLHEDGSLIIHSIRDIFSEDVSEVIISGRTSYRIAKDYVKALMPDAAKLVKEHRAPTPILTHYEIEAELNKLHHTRVDLPSGGYLIINPTEALVSIDVNSGRATQEKNIEETAYKTNMEAATEVARQLRLRDLAGLVVIDFIDMENRRNERAIERAMRKATRKDRARIQIASISEFGLLEMSRQRLRPSLVESTSIACTHCNGTGVATSMASAALMVLRSLEDEKNRGKANRVVITTSTELTVYILNHKRDLLGDLEARYKLQILLRADDKYIGPDHRLDLIHIEANGSEKSQTVEIIMREVPESDDIKNRRRRRGNRGRKTNNNNNRKPVRNSKQTAAKGDDKNKKVEKEDASDKSAAAEKDDSQKPKKRGVRRLRRPRKDAADKGGQENKKVQETKNDKSATETTTVYDSSGSASAQGTSKNVPPRKKRPTRKNDGVEAKVENKESSSVKEEKSESKPKRTRKRAPKKAAESVEAKATVKPKAAPKRPVREKKASSRKAKGITVEHVDSKGDAAVAARPAKKNSAVTKAFQRWWGEGKE